MKNLTFSAELTSKVKNNWLTIENKEEFKECKTNSDWCLTFARVSNITEFEQGLQTEIVIALLNCNSISDIMSEITIKQLSNK